MVYQSEAALEQQFIEQLNKQGYGIVSIPDYDGLRKSNSPTEGQVHEFAQ